MIFHRRKMKMEAGREESIKSLADKQEERKGSYATILLSKKTNNLKLQQGEGEEILSTNLMSSKVKFQGRSKKLKKILLSTKDTHG
jgi:hypothetical protein